MTDYYFYPYKSLTGGADGALDSLDGGALKDGDGAVVINPSTKRLDIYTLDGDSAAVEDSPRVIIPDSTPGDKRWVRVRIHLGDYEYLSSYSTLAAAVTAISTTEKTLVIDTSASVSDDLTIPATLKLEIRSGCIITVASGKTLTIKSKIIAGAYQIFAGSGTVQFSSVSTDVQRTVWEVFPEWWGTFPNGTNDTSVLNKAIAAAKIQGLSDEVGEAVIRVGPGRYLLTPGGVSDITCSFDAPHAWFVAAVDSTVGDMLPFVFASGIIRKIDIGAVYGYGTDIYGDVTRYVTGVNIKEGDNITGRIGTLAMCLIGLDLSCTNDNHVGINRIDVGTAIGCSTAIYLASGPSTGSECEGNLLRIDYITYCKQGIVFTSNANSQVLFQNDINIGGLEINHFNSQVGISLAGAKTHSNKITVTGELIPPTGNNVSYILQLANNCRDNIFELCYIDWSKIYDRGDHNIYRLDGKTNTYYSGVVNQDYGKSTLAYYQAPNANNLLFPGRIGDKVWNTVPGGNRNLGWVCTENGTTGNNATVGTWINFGQQHIDASQAWNVGNIATASYTHGDITVAGAALGDFAIASLSNNSQICLVSATVTQANTVKVVLYNPTGGNAAIGNTTAYVRVYKR